MGKDAIRYTITAVLPGPSPDSVTVASWVAKFGAITKVEFSELDESSGGAFVKVFFEGATREVFVRLTEDKKLEELTYVPPMNADP